jgi:hypothetical protein
VRSLRPDWTTLLIGSPTDDPDVAAWDPDAEVIGYAYKPGGPGIGPRHQDLRRRRGRAFRADPGPGGAVPRHVVADADLIREIMADKATTDHKLAFLENGAARTSS